MPQLVHINLDGVSKINQKVGSLAITSASSIQAYCSNNRHGPALNEVLIECQGIQTFACVNQILSKTELGANFVNFVFGFVKTELF